MSEVCCILLTRLQQLKCAPGPPPGREIYRDGRISVFEIDGAAAHSRSYCQNLSALTSALLPAPSPPPHPAGTESSFTHLGQIKDRLRTTTPITEGEGGVVPGLAGPTDVDHSEGAVRRYIYYILLKTTSAGREIIGYFTMVSNILFYTKPSLDSFATN